MFLNWSSQCSTQILPQGWKIHHEKVDVFHIGWRRVPWIKWTTHLFCSVSTKSVRDLLSGDSDLSIVTGCLHFANVCACLPWDPISCRELLKDAGEWWSRFVSAKWGRWFKSLQLQICSKKKSYTWDKTIIITCVLQPRNVLANKNPYKNIPGEPKSWLPWIRIDLAGGFRPSEKY